VGGIEVSKSNGNVKRGRKGHIDYKKKWRDGNLMYNAQNDELYIIHRVYEGFGFALMQGPDEGYRLFTIVPESTVSDDILRLTCIGKVYP
jgi:hypothetical protein